MALEFFLIELRRISRICRIQCLLIFLFKITKNSILQNSTQSREFCKFYEIQFGKIGLLFCLFTHHFFCEPKIPVSRKQTLAFKYDNFLNELNTQNT